jgi:hypothetical protein
MRIVLGVLSAALLLAVGQPVAWAQERVCTFAEWGYGYYTVEELGEPIISGTRHP